MGCSSRDRYNGKVYCGGGLPCGNDLNYGWLTYWTEYSGWKNSPAVPAFQPMTRSASRGRSRPEHPGFRCRLLKDFHAIKRCLGVKNGRIDPLYMTPHLPSSEPFVFTRSSR